MRINYYRFPDEMTIRQIALATERFIHGNKEFVSIPLEISDEELIGKYERTVSCKISTAKKMLRSFGGTAFTEHIDRDGCLFEVTPITLTGNNSTHKYNHHL